jgi:cysteine desulfurase/selenocysteine lyase
MATRTLNVATIRKDFPILETGIAYLDSANTSQRPRQVTGAMLEYFEKFNSNIHRAAYRIAEEATIRYEATREKVRAFINAASTKEIIYVRGTTEAINLVAYSWGRKNIKSGDLIVLTTRTSSRGRSSPPKRARRSSTSTSTRRASCARTSSPSFCDAGRSWSPSTW